MNPEDRLRDLLKQEATTVVPTGDGLARIQARVARRRRLRLVLLPGAALATAGAAAAFFLLGPTTGQNTLTQVPGGTPTGEATPAPSFTCPDGVTVVVIEGPCPSLAPTTTNGYAGPALWPFTSASEAEAWQSDHGDKPWAGNATQVVQHFADDFLALPGLSAQQLGPPSGNQVSLLAGGLRVGVVNLAQLGGDHGPYTVEAVIASDLSMTTPRIEDDAAISSPTSVTGRIQGVDENVQLRLITSAGKQIAAGAAPGGTEVPWHASLSWSDTSWTRAAIVAVTRSPKDGSVNRLVVVPVTRATGAAAAPSFVGLVTGHVSLFDGTNGSLVRQLTFPPAGRADTGATWSGGTLAWVRSQQTGCSDELDRLDSGTASTVVKAGTAHLATPRLSSDGGLLAWLETSCTDTGLDPRYVVVHGGGAPDRRITLNVARLGTQYAVLDVRADGAVLLSQGSRPVAFLPPGATSISQAVQPSPAAGCEVRDGAFDGATTSLWEECSGGLRLATFDDSGARTGAGPVVPGVSSPQTTAFRDGLALVWLSGGDTVGAIARYQDGRFTTFVPNSGCTSVSEPPGCVRAPDW